METTTCPCCKNEIEVDMNDPKLICQICDTKLNVFDREEGGWEIEEEED